MVYSAGIRKILTPNCKSLSDAKHAADISRVDAFAFNGDIYVKVENSRVVRAWCKSPFRIIDFTMGL